jgi:xanthine/uracil permease
MFGVIAKIGAWILSIPNCVLGGALTFLFANIIVSGIKLIGFHRIDRRTHYIVAASLALGVGTALVPVFSKPSISTTATKPNRWWPYDPDMSEGLNSFRVGVMIAVNTSYFIGSVVAIILNLIIPMELVDPEELAVEEMRNEDEDLLVNDKTYDSPGKDLDEDDDEEGASATKELEASDED